MEIKSLVGIFCGCLLLQLSLAAYVNDLSPNTDCKALLAQKVNERAKNLDLVRNIVKLENHSQFVNN